MMYTNFEQDLRREQDKGKQEHIQEFYEVYFKNYEAHAVEYDESYGKYLQHAGVDRVLTYKGTPFKQYWVQEKVIFSDYPNFLFEYEKKSGAEGWAISDSEKADYLLYYMNGTFYIFHFESLRKWLKDNLKLFIYKYRKDTDNKNLMIPINTVIRELNKEYTSVIEVNKELERVN